MKKSRRILSLLLVLAMVVSVALTGCSKNETAIAPPDEVAEAMFKLLMTDDASAMKDALGYESEEAARADILGEDGDIFGEIAGELVGQFEDALGVPAQEEDVQEFLAAFVAMMGKLDFDAETTEMDEKARTAVVTCNVSKIDMDAFGSALEEAAANMDPSMANDPDALVSAIIQAMTDALKAMEPSGETATFDVDFSLEITEVDGKPQRTWVPTDPETFGNDLSSVVLGL